MKFGQPLLTTELSGSIGGATASKARGAMNYFRVRRRPSNPRSLSQLRVRAAVTGLSSIWTLTLSDSQRATWTAIAPENQSGIDVFVAANSLRQQAGLSYAASAPATSNLPWLVIPDLTEFDLEYDAGQIQLKSASNGTVFTAAGNIFLAYFATRKQPAGALAQVAPFRFGGQLTSAGSAFSITCNAALAAEIGALQETDRLYVKLRAIHATSGAFTEALIGTPPVTII